MKKIWSAPEAIAEQFAANEYVAACHDMNRVYRFICDAPKGNLYYYRTSDGKIDGIYTGSGRAQLLGSCTPCAASHEAPTTSAFYDGFVDYNRNGSCDSGEEVIVWRGESGYQGHATAQLDMDEWETAKS